MARHNLFHAGSTERTRDTRAYAREQVRMQARMCARTHARTHTRFYARMHSLTHAHAHTDEYIVLSSKVGFRHACVRVCTVCVCVCTCVNYLPVKHFTVAKYPTTWSSKPNFYVRSLPRGCHWLGKPVLPEGGRERERKRGRENPNTTTLFYKDCSVGSVKNLTSHC